MLVLSLPDKACVEREERLEGTFDLAKGSVGGVVEGADKLPPAFFLKEENDKPTCLAFLLGCNLIDVGLRGGGGSLTEIGGTDAALWLYSPNAEEVTEKANYYSNYPFPVQLREK